MLLKLENLLFCGSEFCPMGLQLDFLFGHLDFDGVGVGVGVGLGMGMGLGVGLGLGLFI